MENQTIGDLSDEMPREIEPNRAMGPLFEKFGEHLAGTLIKVGTEREFATNEHVFFEGEEATFLPIVLSGKIKMVRYPEAGKEIILGLFADGEVFAIPPAMDGKRFPATAVAMVESRLLIVPRGDFLELMTRSSEFSSIVMGKMCGILRDRAETVQILATPSAEQRVANVLLRLTNDLPENGPRKIAHRRQDIAEMAGLSLETTIRVIRRLEDKGLLTIIRGRIHVETTDALSNFVR